MKLVEALHLSGSSNLLGYWWVGRKERGEELVMSVGNDQKEKVKFDKVEMLGVEVEVRTIREKGYLSSHPLRHLTRWLAQRRYTCPLCEDEKRVTREGQTGRRGRDGTTQFALKELDLCPKTSNHLVMKMLWDGGDIHWEQ